MSIHVIDEVNYHSRRFPEDDGHGDWSWFCRWELPTKNGGPTSIQMHGEWLGPCEDWADAVKLAQEDFATCEEPESINTEFVNDR